MFIDTQKKTSKPNYVVEALAVTAIVICLGLNMSDSLSFSPQSAQADGFQGFKMVNVSRASR